MKSGSWASFQSAAELPDWEPQEQRLSEYEQLCPYQDCQQRLGFERVDRWYRCPVCGRVLYVSDTDSDYEDCHARTIDSYGVPLPSLEELAAD